MSRSPAVVTVEDVRRLDGQVRTFADRKVARLLDATASPAFLAVMEARRRAGLEGTAEVALYTASRWESGPGLPDHLRGADVETRSRFLYELDTPTDWLRMLPGNALCQAAIAGGIRGPNAHLVGGPEAVEHAFVMADAALARQSVDGVVVVAFDEVGDAFAACGIAFSAPLGVAVPAMAPTATAVDALSALGGAVAAAAVGTVGCG